MSNIRWARTGEAFDRNPTPEESQGSLLGRVPQNIVRSGLRAYETLRGLPADLVALPTNAISAITRGITPTYEKAGDIIRQSPLSSIFSLPKTAEQLKKSNIEYYGDIAKPQGAGEEALDDIVQDASGLIGSSFLGGIPSLTGTLARGGVALVGNAAKQIAKNLGFSEGAQEAAKLGTFFLSSLPIGRLSVMNRMKQLFNTAEESVAAGQRFKAPKLIKALEKVAHDLEGRDFPKINDFKERLLNATYLSIDNPNGPQVKQAVNLVRDLNKHFKEAAPGSALRKELRTIMDPLRNYLDDYSASGLNPAFAKSWHKAQDIYKGSVNFTKATEFLNKHIRIDDPVLKAIFKATGWWHGLTGLAKATALYGVGATAREGAKFLELMARSPQAAKAYSTLLLSGMSGSTHVMNKALKALESAVKKDGQFAVDDKEKSFPEGVQWARAHQKGPSGPSPFS